MPKKTDAVNFNGGLDQKCLGLYVANKIVYSVHTDSNMAFRQSFTVPELIACSNKREKLEREAERYAEENANCFFRIEEIKWI